MKDIIVGEMVRSVAGASLMEAYADFFIKIEEFERILLTHVRRVSQIDSGDDGEDYNEEYGILTVVLNNYKTISVWVKSEFQSEMLKEIIQDHSVLKNDIINIHFQPSKLNNAYSSDGIQSLGMTQYMQSVIDARTAKKDAPDE